jgi:hypothetical protein
MLMEKGAEIAGPLYCPLSGRLTVLMRSERPRLLFSHGTLRRLGSICSTPTGNC